MAECVRRERRFQVAADEEMKCGDRNPAEDLRRTVPKRQHTSHMWQCPDIFDR